MSRRRVRVAPRAPPTPASAVVAVARIATRRHLADAERRRRVPAVPGNRGPREGRRLSSNRSASTSATACRAGQLLAVLEVPELAGRNAAGRGGREARRGGDQARAGRPRARAVGARGRRTCGATRLGERAKARPNLVAQQDIDEATGRDRVAEAQVATAKAALASAKQQLEVAKAGQNKTQTLVAYARITAPFAGVITRRYADTGAMIQAGTSSQTQAMPLVDLVGERAPAAGDSGARVGGVAHSHRAAPSSCSVEALDKTLTGTVARFADRLDTDTRTMRVEVDVPNPDLELVPGMYADASTRARRGQDRSSSLPVEAIDRTDGDGRARGRREREPPGRAARRHARHSKRRSRRDHVRPRRRATWSSSATARS